MGEYLSSDYLEERASALLPRPVFDFIAGGADDELTLVANREALSGFRLQPRILRDVSSVSAATEVFGEPIDAPLLVAPMGTHRLVHQDGEIATARGAERSGLGYVTSTAASCSLEEVADAAPKRKWYQLYCFKDRGVTRHLIERAEQAGYEALVVTVDAPVLGMRRRDLRNEFAPGPGIRWANLEQYGRAALPDSPLGDTVARYFVEQIDSSLTWDDLEWMKSVTRLPVIPKGVLTSQDARLAVESGLDGVYVSNHGGRQLDRAPATIDALPPIAETVEGAVPVIVDGGFRSAGDVIVALALGANIVAIGRPVLYAAASGGEEGVVRYLAGLVDDLLRTMALIGVTSVDQLDSTYLRPPGR